MSLFLSRRNLEEHMAYQLLGSLTSPYVRRLRIYMTDIPYELNQVNYLDPKQDATLSAVNPLKRIPVLLIDGQPLWESRVIFNFLQRTHQRRALSLPEENAVSAIDTLQDQLIQHFLHVRFGHPVDAANPYYMRGAERQKLILAYLGKQAGEGRFTTWDYPAIALYTMLDWSLFRGSLTTEDLSPALLAFHNKHRVAAEVVATDPRSA